MATEPLKIGPNLVVALEYTLTDSEGDLIDQSDDGDPIEYLHGCGNIVEGLERELLGHVVGDQLRVVVPPELAYGPRDDEAIQSVPRDQFPEDMPLEEGMQLAAEGPDGDMVPLWVLEVGPEEVLVDGNHPLAGETLTFDVKVVSVRKATAEELEHGHVHGPHTHH